MAVGLVLKDPSSDLVERVAPIAEARGCTHLLFPELSIVGQGALTGRDPFVSASIALATTTRLHAGTAVAGTIFHTARHLALRAATLQEQSGGRFVLGCGVSHRAFADELGLAFPASPLAHVRAYCEDLRTVSARLAFGGGFPIWLAALGDRMLEAAADAADGVILNWVSRQWLRRTWDAMLRRAQEPFTVAVLLRVGPRALLEETATAYTDMFESYARHFRRQGLTSPRAVVDATCVTLDDLSSLRARVQAYEQAGAGLVAVYPADLEADDIITVVDHIAGG